MTEVRSTVEPFLITHPDEKPPPLEKTLNNVNLNIKCIDFLPLMRGQRSYFWCKRGGFTRGVNTVL